jgi:hypothetical protein
MAAPWVKIDVGTARHPKLAALGPLAPLGYAHFVAVIAYAQEWATDGHVPRAAACTALDWGRVSVDGSPVTGDLICAALEGAGLLGACADHPACLEIHDYLVHQQPRAEIDQLREVRIAAGRKGGQQSAARRAAKQTAKQVLEVNSKQTEVCFGPDGEPEGSGVVEGGILDLSGQANQSKTPSKCSTKTQANPNHHNHYHIDTPSTAYLVDGAPEATQTDSPRSEVKLGELVEAPDYVAAYVRASAALGVSPIPASKARIGKAAKELAEAGKSPDLILAAIERLVSDNKAPTTLPYLLADLEREEAGHGTGGLGRLSPKAQRNEEFIRRAMAHRQEVAS